MNFTITGDSFCPERAPSQLLRAMKLTMVLLIAACIHVSATGFGQKVSISGKDLPLEKVFSIIKKQTGYVFFYDYSIFQGVKNVSLDLKNAEVEDVLRACFQGQNLDFSITNKTISITKKVVKVAIGPESPKDPPEVVGTVRSDNGTPLAGATVFIQKLNKSGATNAKGEFILKDVPNGKYTIEISYIGYEKYVTEILVENHEVGIVAEMRLATNSLDQAVVKGYYTTTNRLNTGNVATVKAEDIAKQPVSNPLAALEGRVPGMVITQTTGVPGGGFTVQIRGQNSIDNGNDPFYVVDGVPYIAQFMANTNLNNIGTHGNPLNYINPADIESIDVLKDADATAIYGSRGANGVVLITTKRGKTGPMKMDINSYAGVGKVSRTIDLLNTQQYLAMRREAFNNDNVTPTVSNAPDLLLWDTTRYTNWEKVLTGGTAHYSHIEGNVSGGNTNTQYLISGGYHRETTVFPGDNADQKASLHFNINSSSTNQRLKVQLSGNYVADNSDLVNVDFAARANTLAPDAPAVFNADGSLNWAPKGPGLRGTWTNPFGVLRQRYKGKTSSLVGNAIVSYEILRGLEFKTSLGYSSIHVDEVSIVPLTSFDPGANPTSGNSSFSNSTITSSIVEPQLNYKVNLGNGTFSMLVGSTFQQNSYKGQELSANGFSSDAFLQDVQAASTVYIGNTTNTQYKYNAVFGRINYSWEDKYIVNLTARRDGSSRFGPDKQFANFGAVGGAWIFSKENFIERSLPCLSFGKIRVSYGTTGNDQVGDYRYLDLYNTTYYPYQNTQGVYPGNLFNPDLAWEITRKLEGGLDLGFLKDRIGIKASWFRNRSSNQLLNYQLSDVTGFNSISANLPATIQNSGLELVVNSINIKTKDFIWSSSLNLTIPRNKLISFPNLANSSYSTRYIIGKPYTALRLFHLIGVDPQTGQFQFADAHNTPTFAPSYGADQTVVADFNKNYYYGGFQNSIQYKGLKLDVLFQFVHQQGIPFLYSGLPGSMNNQPKTVLNHWQKPGDQSFLPMLSQSYGSDVYSSLDYFTNSDKYWVDGSFIRLKNLSLSYSLPENWLNKINVHTFRFYVQGQNLWTITHYKGIDPENQNPNAIPPLRVWTAGFQIIF